WAGRPGEPLLGGADGGDVPLRPLHVVERDEGGLATHREAHVTRAQALFDRLTEGVDRRPLLLGERARRTRRLRDARDRHRVREIDLAVVDRPGDGRGLPRLGSGGEREGALGGGEAGGGGEAEAARPGAEETRPG